MSKGVIKSIFATFVCAIALAFAAVTSYSAENAGAVMTLSVNDAVMTALQNNRSLQIQKLTPSITGLNEIKQKAAFDPSMTSSVSASMSDSNSSKTHSANASVNISKKTERGTQLSAGVSTTNNSSRPSDSLYTSRFVISLTQPLFQGSGSTVNLAGLRQSELDTQTAHYQLQGYAEALISQVVSTYWDYALAQRELQIYQDSLKLAERQLDETNAMVEVGKLAEIERIGAQAEVASRSQALVNAQGRLETLRIKLLGLMHPTSADFWNSSIAANGRLEMPAVSLGELEAHIQSALKSRPDIITARLAYDRGELDVVKTKDGLLPLLSFFITLGNTDYAHAFLQSYGDILGNGHDAQVGVNYSVNLGKRSEKASYEQSLLRQDQSGIAIENMESTVQVDVRNAWIAIQTAGNQITATRATLKLQEEKLRAENEKYKIGRSTAINVAVAQRDLLQSQIDEAQTIADYIKALQALYLAEGDLLPKYGASVQ